MDKGTMWLVALVITATVSGESQVANSSSYMDAAITGFDPSYMTTLTKPNPGRRSKLFQSLATLNCEDKTVLYSFINEEQDRNYLPEITLQKVINFNQYLDFAASSAYEISSKTASGARFLCYENYSSCMNENHERDHTMLQFFKDTGGEVLFAKIDVVTHTITISPLVKTILTLAFQEAVETLYKAAVNPVPDIVKKTFNEFVKLYGTHFSRRTLLGLRAIFGKRFSRRAATVEDEAARRRCVRESAREALTPCMRTCNETTQTVFNRVSVERCGGEEHEPIVAVTGLLPERVLEDWASAAKDSPNPIFYELEPLSTLFTADWFEDYFDRIQIRINRTILSQHFNENLSDYSRRMTRGGSNSPHLRGCGFNSDCQIGTECRNEPDTKSGFSCVLKEDATTTTTTSTTTTTLAPTTSTTTTAKPTTTPTTTTLKPLQACPRTPTCPTRRACPTCPTCSTNQTCPASRICPDSGGVLWARVGQPQILTSHPGFGSSDYDSFTNFGRLIAAPEGYKVHVKILSFDTQDHHDYLFIYDGYKPQFSPVLGLLSGQLKQRTLTSSETDMLLLFVTNWSENGPGFKLTYEAVV